MSAATDWVVAGARTVLPSVLPAARPRLRLVRPTRRARRLPFVLVVVALLALGLVGLLLLSLLRASASIQLGGVQAGQASLAEQVDVLRAQVDADHDPATLAARAGALGMVPGMAGFLGADGKVLGPVPSGAPVPTAAEHGAGGIVVAGHGVAPAGLPSTPVAARSTPAAVHSSAGAGTSPSPARSSAPAVRRSGP